MGVSSISGDSSLSTNWLAFLSEMNSSAAAKTASTTSTEEAASTDGSEATSDSSTDFASAIISALDKDGDGSVSSDELNSIFQSAKSLLSFLDDNASQSRAFEANQPSPSEETASNIISDLDADGDGSVNATESGLAGSQFASLDTDGDGSLTSEEISSEIAATMPPPPPPFEQEDASASESSGGSEYAGLLSKLGLDNFDSSSIEKLFSSASGAA